MTRFAALLLACTAVPALAQSTAPEFSADRVRADVTYLADDKLEGRDAGTPGYDAAAKYVADQFTAIGLKPGNAGGWYQSVPLVERAIDSSLPSALTIDGTRFAHGEQVVVSAWGEGRQTVASDTVFVGYGVVSPDHGIDDYAGLDVAGKTVVSFYGTPKGLPSDVAASLNQNKGKMAVARGAVAMIVLQPTEATKRFPWKVVLEQAKRPSMSWAKADGMPHRESEGMKASAVLGPVAAGALFRGAPRSYVDLLASVDKGEAPKGFALKQKVTFEGGNRWRRTTSPNVVGMIPGSDPALANEAVLLMAHLDHDGVNPMAPGADKIWNGAMDNAAGVATMLEVARAFRAAGTAPKRTVIFAAVTAEEDGLLGSQYLAKHPLPGARIVGVVNLDMPVLLYDFKDVIAFGAEHSELGPMVAAAARKSGLTLSPDPLPEENLFVRSDHYRFVQEGVPSVFLATGFSGGGEKIFRDFLATHYHKPSDQITLPFNWQAGAKFARVNYDIARQIADAPAAPRWYADSPFGKQYAKDAPKAGRPVSPAGGK